MSNSSLSKSLLHKLPGSVSFKAFSLAVLISAAAAYPVFKKPAEESRQGHDYMSSDKPEAIRASQEQLRKEYRRKRNLEQAEAAAASKTNTDEK